MRRSVALYIICAAFGWADASLSWTMDEDPIRGEHEARSEKPSVETVCRRVLINAAKSRSPNNRMSIFRHRQWLYLLQMTRTANNKHSYKSGESIGSGSQRLFSTWR